MFDVISDGAESFVRVTLTEFWTPAVFEGFAQELRSAVHGRRAQGRAVQYLVDARAMPAQSQAISRAFDHLFTQPGLLAARAAVIVRGQLAKHQAMRLGLAKEMDPFFDEEEAILWLYR